MHFLCCSVAAALVVSAAEEWSIGERSEDSRPQDGGAAGARVHSGIGFQAWRRNVGVVRSQNRRKVGAEAGRRNQ